MEGEIYGVGGETRSGSVSETGSELDELETGFPTEGPSRDEEEEGVEEIGAGIGMGLQAGERGERVMHSTRASSGVFPE